MYCRLCLRSIAESGPLQASHIIPRFLLNHSRGPDGRFLSFTEKGDSLDLVQMDWKEHLLCFTCEQSFSVKYEGYLQDVLFLRRKHPVLLQTRKSLTVRGDSDRMALAVLSIFWRAVIASDRMFAMAVLPDYIEAEVRSWLHQGKIDATWVNTFTLRIQRIVSLERKLMPFLMPPFARRGATQFEFVLICAGYMFNFKIPPDVNKLYRRTGNLRPHSNSVRIDDVFFGDVSEVHAAAKQFISKKIPPKVQSAIDAEPRRR